MFLNVNVSNLGNVLRKNLRTARARECIFRASGGINFENFLPKHQPLWRLREFDVCTGVCKRILDMSLLLFILSAHILRIKLKCVVLMK